MSTPGIVDVFKADLNQNQLSRYRRLLRILDTLDIKYIETYENPIIEERPDDTFHQVTAKDANRLDLISFQYYNTPLLWWVIAEASGLFDPFDVPAGTMLRIPNRQSLYTNGGVLY